MKKLLFILLAWVVMEGLSAQNNDGADMPALLENKVWKCNCHKTSNMLWKWNFAMQGGEASFCMMVRERKLFILILYAEIQSKSLNRGKTILSKN